MVPQFGNWDMTPGPATAEAGCGPASGAVIVLRRGRAGGSGRETGLAFYSSHHQTSGWNPSQSP